MGVTSLRRSYNTRKNIGSHGRHLGTQDINARVRVRVLTPMVLFC